MSLDNLTLASAKHLLSQGHITPGQHKRITSKVKKPKKLPMMSAAPAGPASFGALDGAGAGHYMSTVNPGMEEA